MNPLDMVRERLEACFIFNSYTPDSIRLLTGIRMLSQIWIEIPAWYFWLYDVSGTFMMEASSSHTWERGGTTFDSVRFVVRYFPAIGSEAMADLTIEETRLRNSAAFDETGTPVYEQLHVVRQGHFGCGELEFHFSRGGDTILMLLDSNPPICNKPPGKVIQAHCTSLYETLAGMYSLYCQETPGGSYLFGKDILSTTLQALCFSKGGTPAGQETLMHYLSVASLTPFRHHPRKESDWQRLALIKPESISSPLCGCCCSH